MCVEGGGGGGGGKRVYEDNVRGVTVVKRSLIKEVRVCRRVERLEHS